MDEIVLDVPAAPARWLVAGVLIGAWLALILIGVHADGYRAGRTALLYSLDAERARRAPRREPAAPVDDLQAD